jgi:hypothetical protein
MESNQVILAKARAMGTQVPLSIARADTPVHFRILELISILPRESCD